MSPAMVVGIEPRTSEREDGQGSPPRTSPALAAPAGEDGLELLESIALRWGLELVVLEGSGREVARSRPHLFLAEGFCDLRILVRARPRWWSAFVQVRVKARVASRGHLLPG